MASSPTPRFDLLDLESYLMIGIQFSRGCPFNCEFCDIIELYGRQPRLKTPLQITRELEALYALGHRGHVDFVDDNFVGHKAKAKEILRAVLDWSRAHGHPFFFSTEASINLADDDELLGLMRDLDFRYVFIGIESADDTVLSSMGKSQNLRRDIVRDLHKIYDHGIVVNGGFIIGSDSETSESAARMVEIIDRGRIAMPMVGLLFALPKTQLTRRLKEENRLFAGSVVRRRSSESADVDQATSGINFVTKRPRAEVLGDLLHVLEAVYSTRSYFDRSLSLSKVLKVRYSFKPSWRRRVQYARAFLRTLIRLGLPPSTAFYFWRNVLWILFTRVSSLETVVNLMAMYLHFRRQTDFVSKLVADDIRLLDVETRGDCRVPSALEAVCEH